ncbi:MAG: 50S ribosomal protein L11 methyltransferase [Christensenellaceae bacterium]|jgi:ribosomal protein L11 methyltransferase|nr:50S ribosomal protein L11 methyltransferase [Christensenellaceae bacterium]
MDLNRVTIYASEEALELVGYTLSELGLAQYEVIESAETVQRFLDESAAHWDYVEASEVLATRRPCVRVYLAQDEIGAGQLRRVRQAVEALRESIVGIDPGPLHIELDPVREEDWANNWKQYYKPTPIGKRLLIKPSWEALGENPEGRVVLNMDPGMVFGTGTHETTQLSLLMLEEYIGGDEKVVDLGCGSGILSIGALLLGASEAVGIDIDPNAEAICRINLEDNGFAPGRARFLTGNVLDEAFDDSIFGGKADIVAANIVAGVLIPLMPVVPRLLEEGGVLICSGIISERRSEVVRAMEDAGLCLLAEHEQKDWICLAGRLQEKA